MARKLPDLSGKKYGRLTVLGLGDPNGNRQRFRCRCECGRETNVYSYNLLGGKSQSCGCLNIDRLWKGHEEISGNYWGRLQIDAKKRKLKFKLKIEYAWELYLQQERQCVLTSEPICFAPKGKVGVYFRYQTASLDRIDSKKGYIVGNVQWVLSDVNFAKQNMSDADFIALCRKVVRCADSKGR